MAVTTNGMVKSNGHAVMGAGVALQAARRFPDLPRRLGALLKAKGNHVHVFPDLRIITFPTKEDWRAESPLWLIRRSAMELAALNLPGPVYLTRPGCGLGGRKWSEVKPLLESILDDRFVVITPPARA